LIDGCTGAVTKRDAAIKQGGFAVLQGGCRLPKVTTAKLTTAKVTTAKLTKGARTRLVSGAGEVCSRGSAGEAARHGRIISELGRCGDTITLDRVVLAAEVITLNRVVGDQVVGDGAIAKRFSREPLTNQGEPKEEQLGEVLYSAREWQREDARAGGHRAEQLSCGMPGGLQERLLQRNLQEAGRLIAGEGEDGKLISWVLEDCAELLRREWVESERSSGSLY